MDHLDERIAVLRAATEKAVVKKMRCDASMHCARDKALFTRYDLFKSQQMADWDMKIVGRKLSNLLGHKRELLRAQYESALEETAQLLYIGVHNAGTEVQVDGSISLRTHIDPCTGYFKAQPVDSPDPEVRSQ
jgi:hypothetical protein